MAYSMTNADLALKTAVWWKGTPITGFADNMWMRDIAGRAMKWSEHGNRDSEYGWGGTPGSPPAGQARGSAPASGASVCS